MRAPVLGCCGLLLALPAAAWHPAAAQPQAQVQIHEGMCEASAAVAFPPGSFGDRFVVANDEDNLLRVHAASREGRGDPQEVVLDGHLGVPGTGDSDARKADIEGAAWLGDRIYWIGSHARSKGGEERPNQRRFFATTASQGSDGAVRLEPFRTVADLAPALRARLSSSGLGVGDVVGDAPRQEELGSERGGLNIEGLAAGPDGTSLLIGLRAPLDNGGRAILIPFLNPAAVVDRREAETPSFGTPITLGLGNRGIRSLEYSEARGEYLVVAGPMGDPDDPSFDLYGWKGQPDSRPGPVLAQPEALRRLVEGEGFRPEAMIVNPEGTAVRLFSDDGDRRLPDGSRCGRRGYAPAFRSVVLPLRSPSP